MGNTNNSEKAQTSQILKKGIFYFLLTIPFSIIYAMTREEGMFSFFFGTFFLVWCAVILNVFLFSLALPYLRNKNKHSFLIIGGLFLAVGLSCLFCYSNLSAFCKDLAYVKHPETIELHNLALKAEYNSKDTDSHYYLNGQNEENIHQTIEISEKRYEKDSQIIQNTKSVTITYLPNSKHILTILYQ